MEQSSLRRHALALWNEGFQQQARGDLERAIELYTRSIEIYPTSEAYTFRGWAYSVLGLTAQAIAECKKAIEIDPTLGNPYNDIGAYLIEKGDWDEAIEWLEHAKTAPRYEARHFPYINLARVYVRKGLLLRAIDEIQEALTIVPSEPVCLQMLARLRAALN